MAQILVYSLNYCQIIIKSYENTQRLKSYQKNKLLNLIRISIQKRLTFLSGISQIRRRNNQIIQQKRITCFFQSQILRNLIQQKCNLYLYYNVLIQKNKFSLIVVIYTTYKQNQKSIIKSYISSPIHVDSRKQARKKISATNFIQDQILPTKFQQSLEGAQKLLTETDTYQDILTINGFIKYYTAANIRFKIKHPYYIGYHFENVLDVFYNSDQANDPVNVLELIYDNQMMQSQRVKIKSKTKKNMFTDNKEILKKSCPKLLLFLIKNTPKQCYLIKQDPCNFQEQKIKFQSIKSNQDLKNKIIQPQLLNQSKYQVPSKDQKELIPSKQVFQIPQIIVKQPNQKSNENQEQKNNVNLQQIQNNKQNQIDLKIQDNFLLENKKQIQQDFSNNFKKQNKSEIIKQQQAIRKIYSIFQSWKYNFIHLKKSDGGLNILNNKWVKISKQQLYTSFTSYHQKIKNKTMIQGQNPQINDQGRSNEKNYLNYQLHQVIVLKSSKNLKSNVKLQVKDYNT